MAAPPILDVATIPHPVLANIIRPVATGCQDLAQGRSPKEIQSSAQPDTSIAITEVRTAADLADWIPAWRQLAKLALESNVFYEPEFLIPALEHYADKSLRILLAHSSPRGQPNGPKILCGLMPLIASADQRQTRIPSQETWRYPQAFLSSPLIRGDVAAETLTAMWEHLELEKSAPFWVTLSCVGADGPFQHQVTQFLQERDLPFFVRSMHRRAVFVPSASANEYFARWSKVRRHSVTRLGKRLGELGKLQVDVFTKDDDCEKWIAQFLELEARGWKGRVGTALLKSQQDQQFTSQMLRNCAEAGKLMMLALKLDETTIAMKCNALAGNQAFAWKIAYDEDYYKFSPGCVLEKANIELLHEQHITQWMDSCATPNHPMIDSLWPDRRLIQSISIGTNRRGSRLAMASLPLMRWAQHSLKSIFQRNPKPKTNPSHSENTK